MWLATAYFTPGPVIRDPLGDAAKRDADARVLFPKTSNHALVDRLARNHLAPLPKGGVRIFMYEGSTRRPPPWTA